MKVTEDGLAMIRRFEGFRAAAYRDAIERLAADPALCEQFGAKGRAHVVANYTRDRKADEFLECLQKTLNPEV